MKKLISIDGVFVAFASAIGYGFGYAVPELMGAGVLLSMLICFTVGSLPGIIAGKIVFSRFIQEKKSRRILSFVIIIAIFLIMFLVGLECFHYNLLTELPADLGPELVLPLIGFALSCAVKYYKKRKILKKYSNPDEGFVVNDSELDYISRLKGNNNEIIGDYDERLAVRTGNGIFVCPKTRNVRCYLGIPYAKPPVGELRWKAPQKLEKSEKVYEAFYFGHSEIQGFNERSVLQAHTQSEDCLYLNVWTGKSEKEDKKKPVIVYIHGGDFSYGGSADPIWNGEHFVEDNPDVVFVSFNYRLNIFGFVDFSSVQGSEEYADALNLGVLDMMAALEWVKENIAAFGGDPERVTVFGDSAGASTIGLLSTCERAGGLFKRAVVITGSPESVMPDNRLSQSIGETLAKEFNASSMQDLVSLSTEQLKEFVDRHSAEMSEPVCDGRLFPKNLYDAALEGKTGDIEFIFALSNDEVKTYDSIVGEEITQQWLQPYLNLIVNGGSAERKEMLESIIAEKEAETGDRKQAEKWLINYWYSLASMLKVADNLKKAGKKIRCFYWNTETLVDKLGSGTIQIVPTLLGNSKAAETLGSIVNENIKQILQALIMKFVNGEEEICLSNNEIKGVMEINWEEYPKVLSISDKKIECLEDFMGDEMPLINRILSASEM